MNEPQGSTQKSPQRCSPLRSTKIVCTLGPSVDTKEKLQALLAAGMNVARLNFSHGSHQEHAKSVALLKEVRDEAGRELAIMLDTKGPEVRLSSFEGEIELKKGETMALVSSLEEASEQAKLAGIACFAIEPPIILTDLQQGDRLLFDDGKVAACVNEILTSETNSTFLSALLTIENGGRLKGRKGINVPNVSLSLEALTQKDREDICFAIEHELDYIAASFVRSARHVREIQEFVREKGGNIPILSKIENQEGIDHFDEILQASDGIMIARGDLGVELPLSKVPSLQKMMIHKCHLAGKPSITATQMLESMIDSPRPTRAEVSDVANAIYDGTSAVMLSGETAVGSFAVEAVDLMAQVVLDAEEHVKLEHFVQDLLQDSMQDVSSSVAIASVKTAMHSGARAIFCFTRSGRTARLISRLRPRAPILAYTPSQAAYHQMALVWGVFPTHGKEIRSLDEGFSTLTSVALEKKILEKGDAVVMTAGSPFAQMAATNLMMLECIGDVLLKAGSGYGPATVQAPLVIDSGQIQEELKNQAVLITQFHPKDEARYREAAALILENDLDDVKSPMHLKEFCLNHNKCALWNAFGAKSILEQRGELMLEIDPHKHLIFSVFKGRGEEP